VKAYLSVIAGDKSRTGGPQWQVLQDLLEQLVQLEDDALIRLEPPPMPKQEIIFRTSADPHASQTTSFSFPAATRRSNLFPHALQPNSYKGISSLFYRNISFWSIRQGLSYDRRRNGAAEVGVRGIVRVSIKR